MEMAESTTRRLIRAGLAAVALCAVAAAAGAQQSSIRLQCPLDTNGDGRVTAAEEAAGPANVVCRHLAAGDGFVKMADGKTLYTFGFSDIPIAVSDPNQVMDRGTLAANFPAPTISVKAGDELYLTLTNVGMVIRPDLSDPHSVHFHGFPQAAAVFDGVPESSTTINMGASFTYYYKVNDPGTYMYHCHVEATEHMQMGMVGNLYVRARKDTGVAPNRWAYDDDDGTTRFDVEYPVQMASLDSVFHDASFSVQPLPFADMRDDYFVLNGRGYPDTNRPGNLPAPVVDPNGDPFDQPAKVAQRVGSRITAARGQRILLRLSNLSVTDYGTLATVGIPMQVVARDARLLRGGDGSLQYYGTNSVTLGGGESADVILDTASVAPGTYFLYTTNLHRLANGPENFGGQLTHIVVTAN
jgi:FtsP/CotA-like multicopper oxidase with cupredoxin domain